MEIAFENHYDGEIRQRLSTAKSRKDLNEIAFLIDQNLVVMMGARTSMKEAKEQLENFVEKNFVALKKAKAEILNELLKLNTATEGHLEKNDKEKIETLEKIIKENIETLKKVGVEEILAESVKLNIIESGKNIISNYTLIAKIKHLEYNIMFLEEREKLVEEREKHLRSLESQYREIIKGNRNNRKKCSKMIEQNTLIKNEVKDANRQLEELTKTSREQYGKIFRLEDDKARLEDEKARLEDEVRELKEINKGLTKKNSAAVPPLKSIEDAKMETENVIVYRRSNSARVIGRKSEEIELDKGTQRDVDTIHNNNLHHYNE